MPNLSGEALIRQYGGALVARPITAAAATTPDKKRELPADANALTFFQCTGLRQFERRCYISDMRSSIYLFTLLAGLLPAALAVVLADPTLMINGVTFPTRAHWMRQANEALSEISGSPCPFAAFGTVIVNHTASDTGEAWTWECK